jgi:hypothetical protein
MYKELIYVACSSEGCETELGHEGGSLATDVYSKTICGTLLFSNHSSALRAGQIAGWLMMDEGAGGDVCPGCQKRENLRRIGEEMGDIVREHYDQKFEEHLEAEAELDLDVLEELATEEERLRCEYERETGETEERYSDRAWIALGPEGLSVGTIGLGPEELPDDYRTDGVSGHERRDANPESDRADEEFAERVADKRRRPKQYLRVGESAELSDVRKVWGDQGIGISSDYKQGRYHWRVVAGHVHGRGFDQMSELEYTTEQKALDAAYNYGRERCG